MDYDDSDTANSAEQEVPNEPDLEGMVAEFRRLTEADRPTALFYIYSNNDVTLAINEFFRHQYLANRDSDTDSDSDSKASAVMPPQDPPKKRLRTSGSSSGANTESVKGGDDQSLMINETMPPTVVVTPPPKKRDEPEKAIVPTRMIRLVSYNIDGLSEKNFAIRMAGICNLLLENEAQVVFLQEVIDASLEIFRDRLGQKYSIFTGSVCPTGPVNYFTATLVLRSDSWIRVVQNQILPFEVTQMGRNVLSVDVLIDEIPVRLLNTHLESTSQHSSTRQTQLRYLFSLMSHAPDQMTVIAGGDLNLRDHELCSVGGLPEHTKDAWIATGRRPEVQYTWDITRNENISLPNYSHSSAKFRFDRILVRDSQPPRLELIHFGLIGLKRLMPYRCFPSDHWGLLVVFKQSDGRQRQPGPQNN